MTRYIFNGVLTNQQADWARDALQKCPFAIQVQKSVENALADLFKDRSYTFYGENCMGQSYKTEREGLNYRSFPIGDTIMLFLPDRDAYERVCNRFECEVVDFQPFKTEF